MNLKLNHQHDCKVYPGEFTPVLNEKILKYSLHHNTDIRVKKPKANIIDTDDLFIIEMFIPGFSREDFILEVNKNILSVFAINRDNKTSQNGSFKIHEFECKGYERHITLPENADASFVNANYTQGILKLIISKSERADHKNCKKIIVY